MTYTLWSRGRLLGESPLDFARWCDTHRCGFLYPTTLGEKLLPVAAGVPAASIAFGKALRVAPDSDQKPENWHRVPGYADYMAAFAERDALELELRGPDGDVVPTEYVDVRDTEFLIELGEQPLEREEELTPEQEAEVEDLVAGLEAQAAEDAADSCWRPAREDRPWMRYQLQVQLIHDWSIP